MLKKLITFASLMFMSVANLKAAENSSAFDIISPDTPSTALVEDTSKVTTSTLTQLETIKEQLRTMRGDIEKLQFENSKLNEKLTRFAADTELRFNELIKNPQISKNDNIIPTAPANSANTASKADEIKTQKSTAENQKTDNTSSTETKNAADNIAAQPLNKDQATDKKSENNTMQKRYQEAYSLIKSKEYKGATEALEKFVIEYPSTELTGNAYYWLGEVYSLKSELNKAAINYLKGYQANVKGTRAPDNLLKLAKLLAKMEKKKEACTTLTKLKKEFPTANPSIQKQAQEETKKLKCNP